MSEGTRLDFAKLFPEKRRDFLEAQKNWKRQQKKVEKIDWRDCMHTGKT